MSRRNLRIAAFVTAAAFVLTTAPGSSYALQAPLRTDPRGEERQKLERDFAARYAENAASDGEGIPLDEYVVYRDLLRSEPDPEKRAAFDIASIIQDPGRALALMRKFHRLRPKRIDTLITRQSAETSFQSIVELVSNALDATTKTKRPIGRFGMGGLQVLSYLLDPESPALDKGNTVVVETKPEKGPATRIVFFKGTDGRVRFKISKSNRKERGTSIQLQWHAPKNKRFLEEMRAFLRGKFSLSTRMPVYLDGALLNRLDSYIYLDGMSLQYDQPHDRVDIRVDSKGIEVLDQGEGMGLQKILDTYLIPREGRGIPKETPASEEIRREIAFFYRAPAGGEHEAQTMRVALQVAGVRIQSFEIEGIGLPEELILELPSLSRLNVARNEVEIDEVIHLAVREFSKKLVDKSPLHRDSLINGFLAVVRWMDQHNKRVQVTRPLLEAAREVLLPWVERQEGLLLPNEEGFHEIQAPAGTRFLDPILLLNLHPSVLPGAVRLENEKDFAPGTLLEAYTVPFKETSRKSHIILGHYLIVNEAIYQKHKDWPVLLNLRLKFHIGYGEKPPAKGTFLNPEKGDKGKKPKPKKTEGAPAVNLDAYEARFPVLKDLLPKQKERLTEYLDAAFKLGAFKGEGGLVGYLEALSAWLAQVPRVLLNQVEIGDIRGLSPGEFLKSPKPNGELLRKYLSFYGDPEKKNRFQDYVMNLLSPALPLRADWEGKDQQELFLALLTFLPRVAIPWLDEGTLAEFDAALRKLEEAKKGFDRSDLVLWEKFFAGVEKAAPHIQTKEAFRRFLTRWLRLFSYDPKSSERFVELLAKRAARETKDGTASSEETAPDYTRVKEIQQLGEDWLKRKGPSRVAVLPDGNLAVYSEPERSIYIVDSETGEEVGNLDGQPKGIWFLQPFEMDGALYLASGGFDGRVRIRNLETGLFTRVLGSDRGTLRGLQSFKMGGKPRLASAAGDGTLSVWDPETGQELEYFDGHRDLVMSLQSFTIGGKVYLASGSRDGTIRVWDAETPGQNSGAVLAFDAHPGGVSSLSVFEEDGNVRIASWGEDGILKIWDAQKGTLLREFPYHASAVDYLQSFTVGKKAYLASAGVDKKLRIIDAQTGAEVKSIPLEELGENARQSFTFLPNGDLAFANPMRGAITVVKFERAAPPEEARFDYTKVKASRKKLKEGVDLAEPGFAAVLQDGTLAVANLGDDSISIIDPTIGNLIKKIKNVGLKNPQGLAVLQDGTLAVANEGSSPMGFLSPISFISIIDPDKGTLLKKIRDVGLDSRGLVALQDGTLTVANLGDGSISIIDPKKGTLLKRIENVGLEFPQGLAVLQDGTLAVANRADDESFSFISIIDLKKGALLKEIKNIDLEDSRGLVALQDGTLAVANRDACSISIIDPKKGTLLKRIENVGLDFPQGLAVLQDGTLAVANVFDNSISIIEFEEVAPPKGGRPPKRFRSGFEALDASDDLSGFPPLTRNLVRFLRDEQVELLEEKPVAERPAGWEKIGEVRDLELARLNLLFDEFGEEIASPRLRTRFDTASTHDKAGSIFFERFREMVEAVKGKEVDHYRRKVESAIAGQDTSQRVWVREAGVQNPRDAIRKAGGGREERDSSRPSGAQNDKHVIVHENFLSDGRWVYSIQDPVGMNLWELVRYYFPLDESSKTAGGFLGFFGLGNYTLFSDFDEVFIRTSPSDSKDPGFGIVNEITIVNDPQKGPAIRSWSVYKGDYRGTEIRRIKSEKTSDPMLESIFIQDALHGYAGAVGSVPITYNGNSFKEDLELVSVLEVKGAGILKLWRSKNGYERVIVDEIRVKDPGKKERRFIPEKVWDLLSRHGSLQVELPGNTPLNIPRNDYLGEFSLPLLHLFLKGLLRDHVEKGIELPGYPEDYLSNEIALDDPTAGKIAAPINRGDYDQVQTADLRFYLEDEKELFELLTYITFELSNGSSTTLHEIREIRLAELRRLKGEASREKITRSLGDIFSGMEGFEAFEDRMGEANWITAGLLHGLRTGSRDPSEILKSISPAVRQAREAVELEMLRLIGVPHPEIGYYYQEEPRVAHMGTHRLVWNLYHVQDEFGEWHRLLAARAFSPEEWEALFSKHTETVVHESQHFELFETSGDHTHHADETISEGFRMRMGEAIDRLLFDMRPPLETVKNLRKDAKAKNLDKPTPPPLGPPSPFEPQGSPSLDSGA